MIRYDFIYSLKDYIFKTVEKVDDLLANFFKNKKAIVEVFFIDE